MSAGTDIVKVTEVLALGERSLGELADDANREHALVLEAGVSMAEHAVLVGEALLSARAQCERNGWERWLETNFDGSRAAAYRYQRLARHRDAVAGQQHIHQALRLIHGTEAPAIHNGLSEEVKEEAKRLRNAGVPLKDMATALGVSRQAIARIFDPRAREKQRERARRSAQRKRDEKAAHLALERERVIKRAVRKAGAATQEAWAMAERMQDVLAAAQRETEDREARRALSEAGVHYRKMRDEIVRALGVS